MNGRSLPTTRKVLREEESFRAEDDDDDSSKRITLNRNTGNVARTVVSSKVRVLLLGAKRKQPHHNIIVVVVSQPMMKAAVYREFGGPIRIEDLPIPKCPADGVLVQVGATGVCRSDWHGWRGHDGDIIAHGLPFVPGHEFSGTVVQVGPSITSAFRAGDRVVAPFILSCGTCRFCRPPYHQPTVCLHQQQPGFTYFGSFAEFVAIPRAARNVKKLPDRVSLVQAAALGCRFTTAYRAVLQQGRLQAGQSVGIFGCGGVGLSCIMCAVAQKAYPIIAVDVSQRNLAKARQLGATHVMWVGGDGAQQKEVTRQAVKALTAEGLGCDLAIDAAGFAATCENAVHCTRRGGRMVQVGLPIGETKPVVPMGLVAAHEIEIVGSHGFDADDLPQLLDMVANQALDPAVLVERQVSLEQGAAALMDMDHGSPLGVTVITQFRSAHL